ncbi:hypothetical protein ASD43_01865 [Microbacterium sp. Root553]|nr:hypothetical protein ASD43_01865 [Microbacterium sp. Root553]
MLTGGKEVCGQIVATAVSGDRLGEDERLLITQSLKLLLIQQSVLDPRCRDESPRFLRAFRTT